MSGAASSPWSFGASAEAFCEPLLLAGGDLLTPVICGRDLLTFRAGVTRRGVSSVQVDFLFLSVRLATFSGASDEVPGSSLLPAGVPPSSGDFSGLLPSRVIPCVAAGFSGGWSTGVSSGDKKTSSTSPPSRSTRSGVPGVWVAPASPVIKLVRPENEIVTPFPSLCADDVFLLSVQVQAMRSKI